MARTNLMLLLHKGCYTVYCDLGLSKADAISKITKAAEIIGIQNIGQIKPGFKASLVVLNGDPFLLSSYSTLVVAEDKTVYKE